MTLRESVAQFNDATNNKPLLKLLEGVQNISSVEDFKSFNPQITRDARQFAYESISLCIRQKKLWRV